MLLGQRMLGGWPWPWTTRTSNEQAIFEQALVAKQVTVVTPTGKQLPLGGVQPANTPLNTVGAG